MSVKHKDYYRVLGLKRGATDDQIRRAFRILARKYHPDVNLGDRRCEDKFKEINEAYEVLGDSEKRGQYDQIGAMWNAGTGFPPPPPTPRNSHPDPRGVSARSGRGPVSEVFEALFGGAKAQPHDQPSSRRRAGKEKIPADAEIVISLEDAHRGAVHKVLIQTYEQCLPCKGLGAVKARAC